MFKPDGPAVVVNPALPTDFLVTLALALAAGVFFAPTILAVAAGGLGGGGGGGGGLGGGGAPPPIHINVLSNCNTIFISL